MYNAAKGYSDLLFHTLGECDCLEFCPYCKSMDSTDFEIMLARTKAHGRGANPVEIQVNVEMLNS